MNAAHHHPFGTATSPQAANPMVPMRLSTNSVTTGGATPRAPLGKNIDTGIMTRTKKTKTRENLTNWLSMMTNLDGRVSSCELMMTANSEYPQSVASLNATRPYSEI